MSAPCRGTALRTHKVVVRLAKQDRPGRRSGACILDERIVDLRRLLRSEMSIAEIASKLGVSRPTLRNFVKRRNICNLEDRRNFNTLQRSLAKLGTSPHSSDVEQPHCRRTRADSSPAAGTISESAIPQADTTAVTSAPNSSPVTAVTHSPREVSSAVAPGMAHSNSDPLAIPDFLRRLRIKPEGEAAVILNETRNIQETQS